MYKTKQTVNLLDPQSLRYLTYSANTIFDVQFPDDPVRLSPDFPHLRKDKVLLRTINYPPRIVLVSMTSFFKYFERIHYYEASNSRADPILSSPADVAT